MVASQTLKPSYGPMDVSLAPETMDGAIEVASQFCCMRIYRQDPPNKKAGAWGVCICKFGLDRSGPSWLSPIAVYLSARPVVRRDLEFMWKCLPEIYMQMLGKRYVTFAEIPKANKRHARDYSCKRNHIPHELHYVVAERLIRGWLRGSSP